MRTINKRQDKTRAREGEKDKNKELKERFNKQQKQTKLNEERVDEERDSIRILQKLQAAQQFGVTSYYLHTIV